MQQDQFILSKGLVVRSPSGHHYAIEGHLGQGKMGAVYLVRDRNDGQGQFALKEVINPDVQDRLRFAFESEVLKRLHHRALPRIHDVFENEKLKRVYILMDYIAGRNLEDLRQDEPQTRFELPLVLLMMAPIVDALNYLHQQEPPIIHRDIKPANVILPANAEGAMLVDFSSAKEFSKGSGSATNTITAHHSPGYAAPEQYGSGTSPRTDVYGLGATLYALLTGVVPPDATLRIARVWEERGDILKPAHILVPTLSEEASNVLTRALSVKSADRFATVEDFWQALTASVEPIDNDMQDGQQQAYVPLITPSQAPVPSKSVEKKVISSTHRPGRNILLWLELALIILIALFIIVAIVYVFVAR